MGSSINEKYYSNAKIGDWGADVLVDLTKRIPFYYMYGYDGVHLGPLYKQFLDTILSQSATVQSEFIEAEVSFYWQLAGLPIRQRTVKGSEAKFAAISVYDGPWNGVYSLEEFPAINLIAKVGAGEDAYVNFYVEDPREDSDALVTQCGSRKLTLYEFGTLGEFVKGYTSFDLSFMSDEIDGCLLAKSLFSEQVPSQVRIYVSLSVEDQSGNVVVDSNDFIYGKKSPYFVFENPYTQEDINQFWKILREFIDLFLGIVLFIWESLIKVLTFGLVECSAASAPAFGVEGLVLMYLFWFRRK